MQQTREGHNHQSCKKNMKVFCPMHFLSIVHWAGRQGWVGGGGAYFVHTPGHDLASLIK